MFQREVYKFAGEIARQQQLKSVLDIGCMDGEKLDLYLSDVEHIVGVDINPVGDRFIKADIEGEQGLELLETFDMIIASDIVEHLKNPIKLFEAIRNHSHEDTYVIISTPDGDTTLKDKDGHPLNGLRVREWGREMFIKLLDDNGFNILRKRYAIESEGDTVPYVCNYFLCDVAVAKKKVLISVPNGDCWIHKEVNKRLMQLQQDTRYELKIITPTHRPYENNLHHIVGDVLEGGYDFWLNIDSDNPPQKNPLDLVAINKDIIGLPAPVVHFDGKGRGDMPVYWNAYDYVPEADAYRPHKVYKGIRKVDAIGTGCVLYARRVFEHPEMQKGCFNRKL